MEPFARKSAIDNPEHGAGCKVEFLSDSHYLISLEIYPDGDFFRLWGQDIVIEGSLNELQIITAHFDEEEEPDISYIQVHGLKLFVDEGALQYLVQQDETMDYCHPWKN